MRNISAAVISICLISCQRDKGRIKTEIMETDRAFSAMSKDKGVKEAFIFYAADEVVKPQPQQNPIVGKQALIQSYEGKTQDYELTWEPIKADADGYIGYTFGNYFLKTKTAQQLDTVLYGNYVSIWKRQSDETWKYVLDTGNPTPGPSKF